MYKSIEEKYNSRNIIATRWEQHSYHPDPHPHFPVGEAKTYVSARLWDHLLLLPGFYRPSCRANDILVICGVGRRNYCCHGADDLCFVICGFYFRSAWQKLRLLRWFALQHTVFENSLFRSRV